MPRPATARAPVPREAPRRRRARGQRGPDRTAPGTDRAAGRGTGGGGTDRRSGAGQTAPAATAPQLQLLHLRHLQRRNGHGGTPDPAGAAEVLDAAERPGAADAAGAGHRPWPSDRFPPGHALPGRPGTAGPVAGHAAAARPHRARRRGPRLPVLAVGGAVAALALMTGTAYVMGGDDAVPADGAEAAALAHPDAAGLPASGEPLGATELFDASGSGVPGAEGTGPRVAFGLGGEPDFTPAGTLSTGSLPRSARKDGHVRSCTSSDSTSSGPAPASSSGDEVLELRLTDGRHFATVLEQHASTRAPAAPPAPARAEVSPINVLTGHTAVADGFTPGQGRHAVGRPRTRKWLSLGQPCPALPGHLPDRRRPPTRTFRTCRPSRRTTALPP